jgi:hypothetical protein
VEELQPYIVTFWHGHRDDEKIPEAVRAVWAKKFQPGNPGPLNKPRTRAGIPGQPRIQPANPRIRPGGVPPQPGRPANPEPPPFQGPMQSNVDLAILDPKGELLQFFDASRPTHRQRGESLAAYTAFEVRLASSLLQVERLAATPKLELPDLPKGTGIRVMVRLMDDRMVACQAPVVEVDPLTEEDWKKLAYPRKERRLEARDLKKWLCQVYPSGVMERTNQQTKKVYQIASTEGTLILTPAGEEGAQRYAILRGKVRFTDEGADGFSYDGKLEIVLTYGADQAEALSLRGTFEGIYPRTDRRQNRTRELALQAIFESRPQ